MVEEEFIDYQIMQNSDIPDKVWDSAVIREGKTKYHRMDTIWGYLSNMKNPDNTNRFGRLSKVAMLILVISHSNTEKERVFSLVTKNKTNFRPNPQLDGTLASLISVKLANSSPCQSYEPPKEVIESAKKATMDYNRAHSSKHQ